MKIWGRFSAIENSRGDQTISPDDRWEEALDHDERSEAIFRWLQAYDQAFNNIELDLQAGGDGDFGETLMYLLDEHYAAVDAEVNR